MSCDVPFGVYRQDNPARFPQREASRDKSTEEKGDMQGRGGFFCRLAIGVLPVILQCGQFNISFIFRICIVYVSCVYRS